jgi:uncharacterized membrane protein
VRPLGILFLAILLIGCGGKKPVSFKDQIQPILNNRCVKCHGTDVHRRNVVMTSYETFMNSRTASGKEPLVIPGNPAQSRLYILCATSQAHFRMPPDTSNITPLPPAELELLGKWIMQGAKDN